MYDLIPAEIWLYVLKQMEIDELFKKRKVCKDFKILIDNNLKYFYVNYARQYSSYLSLENIKKKCKISITNFISCYTKIFIEGLSNYNCSIYFIKKMQENNFTLSQVKLMLDLYQNHNIEYHASINLASIQQPELDIILDLKNNGFPIFHAHKIGTDPRINEEKIKLLKKLKSMEISEYFCSKITFEFTPSQLNKLYILLENKNISWYDAIMLVI
jgi:DNA-binding transcriptional MerR regulator